jgi:hypothetical protein
MAVEDGDEFIVVDVSESPIEVGLAQEPEVGHQLA